jgi:hypothetical protein
MRSGLLSDLISIGYEIFLEGNDIRYRYQKPGNPPDIVKPLINELKQHKTEVVNILKMGTITPSNVKAAWPPEVQSLVDWFLTLDQPTEPFYLEGHRRIVNPAKFFSALRMDIKDGPYGPRGKHGIVIQDLITLKKVLH